MKRKFISLILAAFVSTSFIFNPAFAIKVQAQENIQVVEATKVYSQNNVTTIANGVGAIEAPATDVVANADHMIFGNGKRSNNGNGYPLNGTLKNIELYDSAISEAQILSYHEDSEEKGVFTYKNAYYKTTEEQKYESTSDSILTSLKSLDNGSITVRYRADSASNGVMSLFSLSDSTQAGKYMSFYVNPSTNSIGVEVVGSTAGNGNFVINDSNLTGKGVSIKNTDWHTVTVIKTNGTENDRYTFYIDGKMINFYSSKSGFTNNINTADTINIGHVKRLNNANNMPFTGAIDSVKVLDRVLAEAEIQQLHKMTSDVTTSELDLTNAYKTEEKPLFYSGYDGSLAYRIPSLFTTKDGTVLAAIDKRNQHSADYGNIDTMIRRKEAGASDFDEGKVILDLADNSSGISNSAFLIDPSMVQDKETGRIYMIVDMYPESQGIMNNGSLLKTGTGYKKVDGKDYQLLYDASNNEYTIREGGKVYDADGDVTEYTITTECEAPYKELGNIYKNGEYKGNAYLFSGSDKGELNIVRTSYIWLMHSDDDGKTWSLPKDITPQIKKDWMKFIGVGPGVGIQLENGNLVFSVYHTHANVGVSQSSAVIVSEDKGETWTLGESPMKTLGRDPETMTSGGMLTESQVIQTNNGELKLFMRNTIANTLYVATSNDGGKTWYKVENDTRIPEIYCQLSVIDFEKDGKEYVVLSNPELSGRTDGKVRLGEIAEDGSITWTNSQYLAKGHFQYSSLTKLPDGKFAVLYELDDVNGNISINYTEFDENWIKATNKTVNIPNPNVTASNAVVEGNKVTVSLDLTQKVFVAGQPTLALEIGNKTLDASYVKGSGTDKLVFEATLNGDEVGTITATAINETNGIVENALGGKLPEINKNLYDLTKISKESYEGVTFTSQHSSSTAENTDGATINVIDGNANTYWHSTWGNENVNLPQSVTLQLKEETKIYKLSYLPRQNSSSARVKNYDILTSTDGINFTKVVSGTFLDSTSEQSIEFIPVDAKYIKFQATNAYGGGAAQSAAVAELGLYKYENGVFGEVDKSPLTTKVNEAKELIKGAYSEASIAIVQEQLTKSEEILNASIVSQSMIDNALKNLSDSEATLIDISKISEAVTEFEGLNSNDYTNDSWEAYSNAIEQAKTVAKTATTKKQVTNSLVKVTYAKANLINVTAVSEMNITVPEGVKVGEDFELKLGTKNLISDSIYEMEFDFEYDKSKVDFVEAISADDSKYKVTAINADDSVKVVVTSNGSAITNSEDIVKLKFNAKALGKDITFNMINGKVVDEGGKEYEVANSSAKISILEVQAPEVDKTFLGMVIDYAKDVKSKGALEGVIPAVVTEFEAALKEAETIFVDSKATTGQVDSAEKKLTNAIWMLEFKKGDKTELTKLIKVINTLDESKYTASTWGALQVELQKAKNVIIDENAMEKEITNAYDNLIKAFVNLEVAADKSKLEILVNTVEDTDASKYTAGTVEKFNLELDNAKAILDNKDVTQEQVDESYNKLIKAYLDLRLIPDKSKLEGLINKVEAMDLSEYTEASVNRFNEQLAKVKAVLNNEEASQKEVDEASNVLEFALDGLELAQGGTSNDSTTSVDNNNNHETNNNSTSANGNSTNSNDNNKLIASGNNSENTSNASKNNNSGKGNATGKLPSTGGTSSAAVGAISLLMTGVGVALRKRKH